MNKKPIILAAATFVLAAFTGYADNCEEAKANWDRHCSKCHGKTGAADTPIAKKMEIKDYTNPESLADLSDEELFNMTKDGVEGTKMPGFGKKLSDEEIKGLVAYMRSMAKS